MFGIYLIALLPILFLGLGGIRLIYGRQYAGAGNLMLYFAIPLLLIYFGQLRMWYIVIENHLRDALFISVLQASVSIISNYVLIRHFGAAGAVVAIAVIALSVYVFDAIFKPGRRNVIAMIRAVGHPADAGAGDTAKGLKPELVGTTAWKTSNWTFTE